MFSILCALLWKIFLEPVAKRACTYISLRPEASISASASSFGGRRRLWPEKIKIRLGLSSSRSANVGNVVAGMTRCNPKRIESSSPRNATQRSSEPTAKVLLPPEQLQCCCLLVSSVRLPALQCFRAKSMESKKKGGSETKQCKWCTFQSCTFWESKKSSKQEFKNLRTAPPNARLFS